MSVFFLLNHVDWIGTIKVHCFDLHCVRFKVITWFSELVARFFDACLKTLAVEPLGISF